jgi:hypothetical protein
MLRALLNLGCFRSMIRGEACVFRKEGPCRDPDRRRHGAAATRLVCGRRKESSSPFSMPTMRTRPKSLETQVALPRSRPEAAMLYAPTLWWYPGAERPLRGERLGVEPGRVYPPPELAVRILLRHEGAIPCTCAVLVRRDAALAVGGFEQEFRLYEDQTLWAKLFVRYPVLVAGRPTARYRQHDASTSAEAARKGEYHDWRRHDAEARFLEWFLSYYSRTGVLIRFAQALNRALAP